MKKTLLALTLAALTLPAFAQDKNKPEPEITVSGNVGLFSDYRFRGISQTDTQAALQGGFDLAHKSGLYLGTWSSNVSGWANERGSQEIDLYGGIKIPLPAKTTLDIGYIAYRYPGNDLTQAAGYASSNNSGEYYLGFAWGPASYKFSKTTSDWFGVADSKGSYYHDLTISYAPTDSLTMAIHAGYQRVMGNGDGTWNDLSFTDYSGSINYLIGDGYSVGVKFTGVNFKKSSAKTEWFTSTSDVGKELYKNATVFSLTKTF